MTGSGDGYRSPEPQSRLDTLSPLHHPDKERLAFDRSPKEIGTGPPFSAEPSLVTQSPKSPSPSVFPAELMVYNDLMMDISTAQYLGIEIGDPGPPPSVHPSTPTNYGRGADGMNEYRWQGVRQDTAHELPQKTSLFDYSQPDQPQGGMGHTPAQQMGTEGWGPWPAGGVVDYE